MAKAQRHKAGNTANTDHGSRHCAAQIISRWLTSGEFPSRLLNNVSHDRAFVTELVYGVVRWKRLLEWIIGRLVRQKPSPTLNAFLLAGLYQILMMKNVAEYAAVNETVAAAKFFFSSKQGDFVNAILRRGIAEKKHLHEKIEKLSAGIRYSHPDVLIERWTKYFGAKETERLCAWNNTRPNLIIRLNALMPEHRLIALASELRSHHAIVPVVDIPERLPEVCVHLKQYSGGPRAPRADGPDLFFTVPHGLKVEDLPGYSEGLFLVVDPFVQNAVDSLSPEPGENVLDACAAPGGKTFLIAERMQCRGRLTAMDLNEDRLKILRQNLSRLRIENFVEVKKGDILDKNPFTDEQFDRILADVPCSNTGVIRRKPDVRWRFCLKGQKMLVETQKMILDRLAAMLKNGGTLVYSTCSIEPEENEKLVAAWLDKNPGFHLAEERKTFPPESGTDGGYAAAITKK